MPIHLLLKASLIQGVGVFTLSPIDQGETVPVFPEDDSIVVSKEEFARLPEDYAKYHVPDAEVGKWWGPKDYHRMTIGWYLNHSDTPNVDALDGWKALRRIESGEELTIDYSFCKFDWVRDEANRDGRALDLDIVE